jgi:hypothetical protein
MLQGAIGRCPLWAGLMRSMRAAEQDGLHAVGLLWFNAGRHAHMEWALPPPHAHHH